MKLSDVVAVHGFSPSELGQIDNAKLYQRQNIDGVLELLCIQHKGQAMRVDRQPLLAMSSQGIEQPLVFLPIGEGISNKLIPKDQLEDYLNSTLSIA